jgi:hypothetical protein
MNNYSVREDVEIFNECIMNIGYIASLAGNVFCCLEWIKIKKEWYLFENSTSFGDWYKHNGCLKY